MPYYYNVSQSIIDWARSYATKSEDIALLDEWKNGSKIPTYNRIENLSNSLGLPLGYFFLQNPPKENVALLNYRTIDSIELTNPSRNLLDTIHEMEIRQAWMKEYLLDEGENRLSFIGIFNEKTDIAEAAKKVREILGIEESWFGRIHKREEAFGFLRGCISNAGVLVMASGIVRNNTHRTLSTSEFRGFALSDELAPLIFINSNDSAGAKLFTLLHEFVHICLNSDSLFNDRYCTGEVSPEETFCNKVAAEVLVPSNLFVKAWGETITESESVENAIIALSKLFKCSRTVVARKAYNNGIITKEKYKEIADKAVSDYYDWKRQQTGRGDYYNTISSRIDKRFLQSVLYGVSDGKVLYTDAYQLTNTNRATFEALYSRKTGALT